MEAGGHFDQRPGAFEATAGLGRIRAVGKNGVNGWCVALMRGPVVIAELSIEEAVELAQDVTLHAGAIVMDGLLA